MAQNGHFYTYPMYSSRIGQFKISRAKSPQFTTSHKIGGDFTLFSCFCTEGNFVVYTLPRLQFTSTRATWQSPAKRTDQHYITPYHHTVYIRTFKIQGIEERSHPLPDLTRDRTTVRIQIPTNSDIPHKSPSLLPHFDLNNKRTVNKLFYFYRATFLATQLNISDTMQGNVHKMPLTSNNDREKQKHKNIE